MDEPRQEGSAWDNVCPPSLTPSDLGWVLLPMANIYAYFSLAFSPGSQEPSSEDEGCNSTYVFTVAHLGNSLQVRGFRPAPTLPVLG